MLSRNTYMEVNLKKIKSNVEKIKNKYNTYKYYFGVVKADCYGLGNKAIEAIIEGGVNYLAVATYEEAISIRKEFKNIPILCLGIIPKEYLKESIENNITITISSLNYLTEIKEELKENAKVHIKLNTGMNRLGIKDNEELKKAYEILKKINVNIEGIYSHIYDAKNKERYEKQLIKFQELLKEVEKEKIEICHIAASEAIANYEKPKYINGCRLGIIMYGFTNQELNLESTFKLKSEVIQINTLEEGETIRIWWNIHGNRENKNSSSANRICRWNN